MSAQVEPAAKNPLLVPALCLILAGLVVWVFWPSVHGTFLFYDESAYIVQNPHVNTGLSWANIAWAFSSLEYANWHPVTWLSHMLDCQLYGLNPWGHHLTNILIHAANTVLVFLVFRKMTGAMWASLAIAVLFGLHPLRVASATYISERRDVLSLFFWMLTLWAYARFAEESREPSRNSKIYYGMALLFFALGLMSKTMLVTLPFVLLLLDYWPLESWRQKTVSRLVLEKLPFFLVTVAVSWLAYTAQHKAGMMQEMAALPLSDRLGNASISYVRYIGKLFWPANLCAYYPHPGHWPTIEVLLADGFLIGISLWAWLWRQRAPYFLVGWFWYVGTLVPVIGFVQLLSQSIADRYTYIPMLGILLILACAIKALTQHWRHQFSILASITAAAVAACVIRTHAEIQYYHDDIALWSRTVAVTENNVHAHYALGVLLQSQSDTDAALIQYREAVRLKPDFIAAQNDLGCLLLKRQLYDEAIAHFQAILKLDTINGDALYNCGKACFRNGELDQAIVCIQGLVKSHPGYSDGQAALDACLRTRSQAEAADRKLREAVRLNPDQPEVLNSLAWFLATTLDENIRNGPEAVQLAMRVCELTHHQVVIPVDTLAIAYAQAGRFDDAIKTAQSACTLASNAGDGNLLKKSRELLELFQAHRPYYEIHGFDLSNVNP